MRMMSQRRLLGLRVFPEASSVERLRRRRHPVRRHEDLLVGAGDHRIGLERCGAAALAKSTAALASSYVEPSAAEPDTDDEAGHRPHARLVRVLVPPPHTVRVESGNSARFGRAPGDRLAVDVGDKYHCGHIRLPVPTDRSGRGAEAQLVEGHLVSAVHPGL